jgi:threonyl-tRNA synthetase
MTCPFQYQVFLNRARSYRDLPMRLGETSTLFRNEDSGEMHGLIRVRQFTISEGHLILRPEQLEDEFRGCLDLAKFCLSTVGLLEDCSFRFSQWDPANPHNKYEGTPGAVERGADADGKILDDLACKYTVGIDEAAFYGPKLDIQYKNVYGKEDTLVTIQIDLLLAKQFGMEYVDADGQKKTPYIIHRTSLGCYERTLAYLLEEVRRRAAHLDGAGAGAHPDRHRPRPTTTPSPSRRSCFAPGLPRGGGRPQREDRQKDPRGQVEKVPYMLVIGDRDCAGSYTPCSTAPPASCPHPVNVQVRQVHRRVHHLRRVS